MAEKSKSAYNETGKEDSPEQKDLYHDYNESHRRHGTNEEGGMESSVNSRSGEGIMGGPATHRGHPNVKGYKKK